MRILYIDIDTLRPDHLGCYGYHRNTSPNLDRIAAQGVRFNNFYVSDAPCLPSRTALWSGRLGIHNGVINHGGTPADPFIEGPGRGFISTLGNTSWMRCMQKLKLNTVTVSPFGQRHSAWHWYAGFNEIYNTGKNGMETADEVTPVAIDWIRRNGKGDDWFLHVNVWDPHTRYRTPMSFGEPFRDDPPPQWLTEEVRQKHWNGVGPHSAQEVLGYDANPDAVKDYPRQPYQASSMAEVKKMFDGYDTGIRYADDHVGRILNALADAGVLDDTIILVSSDHGECLGELNIYGDHQTADHITSRVPLIIRWPGITKTPRADSSLHYNVDLAATVVELAGGIAPNNWDAQSFAGAMKEERAGGRDYLVVSQGAWSCQRSVRFDDYICMRSYHDGHHAFPDVMLYDLAKDPHEQTDLAQRRPDLVDRAMALLDDWHGRMMRTATHAVDPMWTVLREGGPFHTRRELPRYLDRLRKTGRGHWADILAAKHPSEAGAA